MSKSTGVISHWHLLVDDFRTSALEFYAHVEVALSERQVPQLSMSRVEWKESGILSANREYLRIKRGQLMFDIGAAPFGTGYFFTWWLAEEPPKYVPLVITATLLALLLRAIIGVTFFSGIFALLSVPLIFFGTLSVVCNAVRAGNIPGEAALLGTPILGQFYRRVFVPSTYFSMDTAIMYQESVHRAVTDVLKDLVSSQGLRQLTPDDLRPTYRSVIE